MVSRYRTRGAVREVGKALGLSEDVTATLSGQVWGWSNEGVAERHVEELGLDANDPRLALTLELTRQLIGTPRHLSQHPGGFVLTRDRLDDLVPIEPATMVDRSVIEWEKDDLEALKIMKVDVLGVGMLGCMRRAFDLLAEHKGQRLTLASPEMQEDDPAVYDMICEADTIGTFQIESRAQMSMLPRLKPRIFYDIVIQVAIVRPGPIQGNMVHPYLRRREGKEPEEYPSPELRDVLEKTQRRAALPGAGDEGGDRRRRLLARQGRRASALDGDLQDHGRGQPFPRRHDRRHAGAAATRRISPSGRSSRSRASAATASPKATPRASPRSPTPRPG